MNKVKFFCDTNGNRIEEEIKQKDERLWQFAKEVEE